MTLRGSVLDEDAGLICTPLAWVTRISDPLLTPPWEVAPITVEEVRACIAAGQYLHRAHPEPRSPDPWLRDICRTCDVTQIADLAAHGWPETRLDPHPVAIDLGVGDFYPSWVLTDGNHRVAAAMVRTDPFLTVSVAGDWDRCVAVLVEGVPLWDAP